MVQIKCSKYDYKKDFILFHGNFLHSQLHVNIFVNTIFNIKTHPPEFDCQDSMAERLINKPTENQIATNKTTDKIKSLPKNIHLFLLLFCFWFLYRWVCFDLWLVPVIAGLDSSTIRLDIAFYISAITNVVPECRKQLLQFTVGERPLKFIWNDQSTSVLKEPKHREPDPSSLLVGCPELYGTGQRVVVQEKTWWDVERDKNIDGVMLVCCQDEENAERVQQPTQRVQVIPFTRSIYGRDES